MYTQHATNCRVTIVFLSNGSLEFDKLSFVTTLQKSFHV